jgi:hypothetical protein
MDKGKNGMKVRLLITTGQVPNLPWWRALYMTDEEIRQYNSNFLRQEIVEYDTDDIEHLPSDRQRTIESLTKWMEEAQC